ncbi:MAG TPA: hypothetical protein VIO36_16525, partial [Anaerolineaceae bacterium]
MSDAPTWTQRRGSARQNLLLWALPLVFLLVFFFVPLGAIFRIAAQSTLADGVGASVGRVVLRSLGFTLWQALLSMLLTMLAGLPAAYLFARFEFPGKRLLRVLTTLPFIMPTVVVAASFNALLGPRGLANVLLMRALSLDAPPINLLNTLSAILLAHVFYNTTVVIRMVGTAWAQLDPRL